MNKFITVIFILGLMSLLLTSCRKAKEKLFTNPKFLLMEKALFKKSFVKDFDENISGLKKFEITFGARKLSFDVQIEFFNNRLTLVAMTPIKSRLFVIQYSEDSLRYLPEPFFRAPLKPVYILRDFYLSEISLEKLQSNLLGFEVKEKQTSGKRVREIFLKDRLVIRITYSKKQIVFKNIYKDYIFKINTVYHDITNVKSGS